MNRSQAWPMAVAEARRRGFPEDTEEDVSERAEDILAEWVEEIEAEFGDKAERRHPRDVLRATVNRCIAEGSPVIVEQRADSPALEDGVDNCNDSGTGEGRFHGRI